MAAIFEAYLNDINKAYLNGDATEHTHRPALKTFVEALGKNISATNEPKQQTDCGKPDMKVARRIRQTEQAFGYIECKDIDIDLKKAEKSEQLKRYLAAIDNLVLTDYIHFRFYRLGELVETAVLAKEGKGGKFVASDESIKDVQKLFAMFYASEPIQVKNPKELAEKMAGMAKLLKMAVRKSFEKESEHGSLHEVYEAFKDVLIHDLTEEQFADMYTQTIVYGLFCARCFLNDQTVWGKDVDAIFAGIDGKREEFSRQSAARLLPKTNPFLKKIFGHLELELDERIAWIVDDVVSLLKNAQMGHVIKYFGIETKKKDPVIHFYETFLGQYDAKLRESRGVYYTPEPVVSYIVRSVDWLLKEKFGLKQGLRDSEKIKIKRKDAPDLKTHRCLILDPAVGTGTFLYEVIKQIHKKFRDKGAWPSYVEEHLLPRLFGFELMMAPYTVCHMKLGLLLRILGYTYEKERRLGVFLTNTLEEAEEITKSFWSSAISEEAREANTIKRDLPIMVVLGNPPYSGLSANMSKWTDKLLKEKLPLKNGGQSYYEIDGKPLGEKKVWLQDDYVKFIRYGQYRIEQTGSGILAFITNHGYLDNPTFRGMRQSLMKTFSEIYILDLHGSTKKKEVCSDGSPDKNVFDIQQGVSIGIFVKELDTEGDAKVYHADLWGDRKKKYEWLNKNEIQKTEWNKLKPNTPYYFFIQKSEKGREEYDQFYSVHEIFKVNVTGIVTARDSIVTDTDQDSLLDRMSDFRNKNISDDALRDKYFGTKSGKKYLPGDTRGWKLTEARETINNDDSWRNKVKEILYRPFDRRKIFYTDYMVDWPRTDLMSNMISSTNLGLCCARSVEIKSGWEHIFCTRDIIQHHTVSLKEVNYLLPLYVYQENQTKKGEQRTFGDTGSDWPVGRDGRVPNLDKGFVDAVAETVGLAFASDGRGDKKKTFGPEDVFAWIYGVFHSPQYRARYAEFLKIDFPRVPLPADKKQFADVCAVGHELVGLHLMEAEILENGDLQPRFGVEGDMEVAKGFPKYDGGKVFTNETQYFEGVREDVWGFMIGGYQVCEKWLKDRRGRQLSYDDVEHYKKICVSLGETIRLMADKRLAIFG